MFGLTIRTYVCLSTSEYVIHTHTYIITKVCHKEITMKKQTSNLDNRCPSVCVCVNMKKASNLFTVFGVRFQFRTYEVSS